MARPLRYEFGLGQVEVSPCMDGEVRPRVFGFREPACLPASRCM